MTPEGLTVGALAAVNAAGSVVIGGGPWFWAAPFEQDAEFGGLGLPAPMPPDALRHRTKGGQRESTTLVVVATDAALTKAQAKRLAVMAQTGLARAIYPVHTPLDGDVVFAAATGRKPLARPAHSAWRSSEPSPPMRWPARWRAPSLLPRRLPFAPAPPSWQDRFASQIYQVNSCCCCKAS